MARWYRISRLASVGLALTLLVLTALGLVGVTSARRSAEAVERSTRLADTYTRASAAVLTQHSLQRRYRLVPSNKIREGYTQADADLDVALDDIRRTGGSADRALVGRLRMSHNSYDLAVRRLMVAVDAGVAITQHIEGEIEAIFDEISANVYAGAGEQNRTAVAAMVHLRQVQKLLLLGIVAGFAVGLCLVATCAAVVSGYRRVLLAQSQLSEYEALHDALTGLPNHTLFTDRLDQALAASGRDSPSLAMILVDLDRFKEVNDTLGHLYGDQLLRHTAARLSEVVGETGTVARLSGDEFAILVADLDATGAIDLAERVLRSIHRSYSFGDVTVDVEASMGVAVATHADTVDEVMRCADVAMYAAKDSKTGIVMYDAATLVHQPSRLLLLGDLRRALEQSDQLILHYQPKVGVHQGQLCGVEALVRWNHPTRGKVFPDEFIAVAESTGLINRLTAYVLNRAIGQARAWLDQGVEVQVAVNLSPRCLLDPTLLDRVRDLLHKHALPAGLLRLEVTEGAVMAGQALALATLQDLCQLGVRLSIDDYGTGYSSMAYLKRLPVDELKIDRSFVLNMIDDTNDAFLVRSAIDLGHNLGMTVVAEGVERVDHVMALDDLGCDIAQGYHYARPMPPGEVWEWIRQNGTDRPRQQELNSAPALMAGGVVMTSASQELNVGRPDR